MTAAPDYGVPDPGTTESIDLAVADLDRTLALLSDDVPAFLEEFGSVSAALLLHTIRERRQKLAEIEAVIEADVAHRYGKGKHLIPGYTVEVRGGTTWKDWRHDDLAWALCRDIAVDPDTGELNPDVTPIIDAVRSRLLNCARPSWRTTQLANHGIKPSDYATWAEGRKTVTLTPDAEA